MNEPRIKNGWGWANLAVGIVGVLYPMVLFCLGGTWCYRNEAWQILLFLIPTFASLIVGVILLRHHSQNRYAWLGIVGLIIGVAGLVATEHRWSYMQARSEMVACESNMIQLNGAKEQWAMMAKLPDGTPSVTNEVVKYLKGNIMPPCPTAKTNTYILGKLGEKPSCSVHGVLNDVHLRNGKKPVWNWMDRIGR